MELLSPAGNMEALRAAVENGADAVYIGARNFSARQSAVNFADEEVASAVEYAHIRGVRLYLAINTLIADDELERAVKVARSAAVAGIDAFIVQDTGFASILHYELPSIPLHASTQMTITSAKGAAFLASLGFTRVVAARELSSDEIGHMCKDSPIEVEVFAHGALCASYSGQCLMSSMIGGRSGNRGRCAQPCRLPYELLQGAEELAKTIEHGYILSMKDLCLVENLYELQKAGVASIKIEGRLKTPEYVAVVTGIYRKYMDRLYKHYGDYENHKNCENHKNHKNYENHENYKNYENNKNYENYENNKNYENYLDGNENVYREKIDSEDYSKDYNKLLQIFNRGGFTKAYFEDGEVGKGLFATEKPKNWGVQVGTVFSYDERKEILKVLLDEKYKGEIAIGDGIEVMTGMPDADPGGVVGNISGSCWGRKSLCRSGVGGDGGSSTESNGRIEGRNDGGSYAGSSGRIEGWNDGRSNIGNGSCREEMLQSQPQSQSQLQSQLQMKLQSKVQRVVALSPIKVGASSGNSRDFSELTGAPVYKTSDAGLIDEVRKTYTGRPFRKIPIYALFRLDETGRIFLAVKDDDGNNVEKIFDNVGEVAQNIVLSREDQDLFVRKLLQKTGDTPYVFIDLEIDLKSDYLVASRWINALRRETLKELSIKRAKVFTKPLLNSIERVWKRENGSGGINELEQNTRDVNVNKFKQKCETGLKYETTLSAYFYRLITGVEYERLPVSRLYFPATPSLLTPEGKDIIKKCRESGIEVFFHTSPVARIDYFGFLHEFLLKLRSGFDAVDFGVCAGNPGTIQFLGDFNEFKIAGDYSLNIFNDHSAEVYNGLGLCSLMLSHELNLKRIKALINSSGKRGAFYEAAVYGRIPMMIGAWCLAASRKEGCMQRGNCSNCNFILRDRLGLSFPVFYDGVGKNSTVFNSKLLFVPEVVEDFVLSREVGLLRLIFTDENAKKVHDVAEYFNGLVTHRRNSHYDRDFDRNNYNGRINVRSRDSSLEDYNFGASLKQNRTRGHYFREIE
ncbi:MAG: U32 family peptidase [Clostridiales bacterium]|nr:U32 family peptidase [Clostridiales bacterium]